MLAEGIHSVADSGNQVLLLVGGKRAEREADPGAPVRLRPRALHLLRSSSRSCCSASAACSRSTRPYHKVHEVHDGAPNELLDGRWWWVAIVVLVGAIVHGGALRSARRSARRTRPAATRVWVDFIRRAKSPELPVVLLEDFAALIGLVLRAARRRADPAHRQRLLGRARHDRHRPAAGRGRGRPRHRDQEPAARRGGQPGGPAAASRERARATPGVERVIHMRTLHLGPEELLVAAKIARPPRRHGAADVAASDRRRRARDPRGRADRPGDLPRARHLRRGPPARPAARAVRSAAGHGALQGTRRADRRRPDRCAGSRTGDAVPGHS